MADVDERRTSIGASMVGAVLGVDDWRTPMQAWMWFTSPEYEFNPPGEAAEIGLALEPAIAGLYERRTGTMLVPPPRAKYRHADYPWLHASPDRVIQPSPDADPEHIERIVELKASGLRMKHIWDEAPPLSYQAQLQQQLICTGAERGSIAVLLGGQQFMYWDYGTDRELQEWLIDKTHHFWTENVEKRVSPKAVAADAETLKRLFPRHRPNKVIELEREALDMTAELKQLEADIATIEEQNNLPKMRKRCDDIMAETKRLLGDAERGILPGGAGHWDFRSCDVPEGTRTAYTRRALRLKWKGLQNVER